MRWALLWVLLIGLVLLPFLLFEHQFNAFAEHVTQSGTSRWLVAGAVFALLALDVFLPVPSSVVSTAAGVLLGFRRGRGRGVERNDGRLPDRLRRRRAWRRRRPPPGRRRRSRARRSLMQPLWRPDDRAVPAGAGAGGSQRRVRGLGARTLARFTQLTALANLGIAVGYALFGAYSLRMDSFLLAFLGALLLPGLFLLISAPDVRRAEVLTKSAKSKVPRLTKVKTVSV